MNPGSVWGRVEDPVLLRGLSRTLPLFLFRVVGARLCLHVLVLLHQRDKLLGQSALQILSDSRFAVPASPRLFRVFLLADAGSGAGSVFSLGVRGWHQALGNRHQASLQTEVSLQSAWELVVLETWGK